MARSQLVKPISAQTFYVQERQVTDPEQDRAYREEGSEHRNVKKVRTETISQSNVSTNVMTVNNSQNVLTKAS